MLAFLLWLLTGAGEVQRDRLGPLEGRDAVVVVPGMAKGFGAEPAGLVGMGIRLGEEGLCWNDEEAGDRGAA